MRATILLAAAFLLSAPGSAAAERWTVFERAAVDAGIGGSIELRRRYATRLELPAADCGDERAFSCLAEREVAQIYEVRFFAEVVDADPDGGTRRERLPRGRAHVASDLSRDDELALEEAIERAMHGTTGDAFRLPYAGWLGRREPFGGRTVSGDSADVAWICWTDDDGWAETRREILRNEAGGEIGRSAHAQSGSGRDADRPSACPALLEAFAAPAPPDREVDSPLFVERLDLLEVTAALERYAGAAGVPRYHPLPEGVRFARSPVENESTHASTMSRDGDGGTKADLTKDGMRHELEAGLANVRPPDASSTAQVLDVRIARRARDFRALSTEPDGAAARLRIVALPVEAESELAAAEVPPTAFAVRGAEGWSAHAAEVFRRHARIDADLAIDAYLQWMVRSGPPGWLVVFCRDDVPAEYALSPIHARLPVENGAAFCDAADRAFPRAD